MVPPNKQARERSENGTHGRILDSAITLFAERGFSEVTVRDIAEHAHANPAAISYYFGAKEHLIKEAIRSVIAPLNEQRLAALTALQSRGEPLGLEDVVRAMVEPTVHACKSSGGPERHYDRVLVLTFALRQPFVDEVMAEQTDTVALRFVDALTKALPDIDRETLFWRYDFMIGALLHILLDSSRGHRLRRVSAGLTETSDPKAIIPQLVRFVAAGLKAPTA